MAYSSSGKKVYVSIKDLPQYTSIGNGDKFIIWNEAREGAATIDYDDFMVDLEHCTFKSTISEIITLASDIQTFISTTAETIESIQDSITNIENTIDNELRNRIKTLEFIVSIMLGSNSFWNSSSGLDILKTKFIVEGIAQSASEDLSVAENDTQREALKWFGGFISTVQSYITKMVPSATADDILLQTKYNYRYVDTSSLNTAAIDAAAASTASLLNKTTVITTTGNTTKISYE